jgi:nucleoside-triphosphatase THEP1
MQNHPQQRERLIVLWALAETALGGFLHASKIPITGFVVGGFAVLAIGLIARYSGQAAWKHILAATSLVLLVKAVLSPQSPPTAYLAVAFQGVCGAALFQTLPYRLAAPLFGALAMIESALQKILVLTLVFGMQIWDATEQAASSLATWIGLPMTITAKTVIAWFTSFYGIWGVLLGMWLWVLPEQISKRRYLFHPLRFVLNQAPISAKKARVKTLMYLLVPVVAIAIGLLLSSDQAWKLALWVFIRAILVTVVLYLLVGPAFRWLLNQWTDRQSASKQAKLQTALNQLATLPNLMQGLYQSAGKQYRGVQQLRETILGLFHWALFVTPNITLFTGTIRSGKTSTLALWASSQTEIGGFLSPDDSHGKRQLVLLSNGQTLPFELDDQSTEPGLDVGRFRLSEQAFNSGKAEVSRAFASETCQYIIIDEVGKLELNNQGWAPELATWIAEANQPDFKKQLILVVRDTLVEDVQRHFQLSDTWKITKDTFH